VTKFAKRKLFILRLLNVTSEKSNEPEGLAWWLRYRNIDNRQAFRNLFITRFRYVLKAGEIQGNLIQILRTAFEFEITVHG
jgi:hypothetical protein